MFKFLKKNVKLNIIKDKSIYDEWAAAKNAETFFSYIERLPNPDIILRKIGKGIGVLRALTNHYQVGTCIDSRKAGTKSRNYEIKENNVNKQHYALYSEIFKFLDIDKLIDDILDAPLYGYNPIEIIWKKEGNYIIPVETKAKPLEWFYFNSEGKFFFKDRSQNGKKHIDLDSYKFLLPRNKADFLNPYGQSVLSRCFWPVAFINGGMEFWVKFTEHLGMPFLFGKYDRSMNQEEQNQMLQALVNMVQNAVGVIPSDGTVEVLQTGSTGNSEIYEKLVNKCENNISKAILGQTLTTDVGNVGSYAAGQVHACVRADIVNSDKNLVKKTINRLIKFINIINFNDDNEPYFDFIEEDLGLNKAERDTKVYSLGVEFSEDYITKTYGYQKGDIKVVGRNSSMTGINFSDFENQTDIKTSSLEQLERLTDLKELEKVINPALKSIIKFFNESRNADDALEKIAELYPDLETKELEKVLTKVIFISDLIGRIGDDSDE